MLANAVNPIPSFLTPPRILPKGAHFRGNPVELNIAGASLTQGQPVKVTRPLCLVERFRLVKC